MELKTESGVSIKIMDDGPSTFLIFSTSVRAIGLNKEETSKIGAALSARTGAERNGGTLGRSEPQKHKKVDPEGF